ncbi:ABC transporter transmembrane domain-containing protein, partial [Dyella sp.]|uniref:ABC transporter transmembrane domain-containing protein n=1 Tax=Dyella sp. TaxID=1869338 RepID=UPI002D79600E
MLFRWFENLIDPFKEPVDAMPPATVGRFYAFYLRQVWPIFLITLLVGLGFALIEVALFGYIGRIVDMANATPAADFFRLHGRTLVWMGFVALVLRPVLSGLHDLLVNQAIVPGLTGRIRWQNHRYVIRQSLGFFQNDFAGRIANRIMQTGPALRESVVAGTNAVWYIFVYGGSAIFLMSSSDVRLAVPVMLWFLGYAVFLSYFVPRLRDRSREMSEVRSALTGR